MKKLYASILFILFAAGLHAQNWQALGTGVGTSATRVYAIAYDNSGNIYAGGDFPGYLRKWNGTSWSSVGSADPNGPVYAIAVRTASDIYVGGAFTSIGGVSAKYVARLGSGGTFTAIGNGFNNHVRALYVNPTSGTVFAGGLFTVDGGTTPSVTYNHIARLSGSSFNAIGSGISSNVYSIVEHIPVQNGGFVLYVGTDNFSAPVSKYESNTWSNISGISGGFVYALASYGGSLYAGGDFDTPFRTLGRLTNGAWSTAGPAFAAGSSVNSLFVRGATGTSQGLLYIGGNFTNTTTNNVNYIGFINTVLNPSFRRIINSGTDLNGPVYAISNNSGKVIAGGKFTTPGMNAVITDQTIGFDDVNENLVSKNLYPNPMTDRAVLKIETKDVMNDPMIEIYDVQSRLINNVNASMVLQGNNAEFTIERSSLTGGTYFYVVRDKNQVIATDRFIVQ